MSLPLKVEIDPRGELYYNKYKYRVRFTLRGVNRTYHTRTFTSFLKKLDQILTATESTSVWDSSYQRQNKTDILSYDMDSLERFFIWQTVRSQDKVDKNFRLRIEGNTCGVFSNDLALLQTVEAIDPTAVVTYSQIDISIPLGIKYFLKEPKNKYRVYLKSKTISDILHRDIKDFIDRYSASTSTTVVVPSGSLVNWLTTPSTWRRRYCYSTYFIDYDEETTFTLMSLFFGELIKTKFKLEKRPA